MIETPTARRTINRIARLLRSGVDIEGKTYYFYRDVEMMIPLEKDIIAIQEEAIEAMMEDAK